MSYRSASLFKPSRVDFSIAFFKTETTMRKHNGKQLYGIQKILTTLKMGMNKEIKKLPIKQKLAMNYVSFMPDKPLVSDRKEIL
jgi:hypothetical protein